MIKNIIIVNDFDYIQGGASKVAIDTANLLKRNYPEFKVYFFSATAKNQDLDENIIKVNTNQNECLKEKNKIKGIVNGLYNVKAKKKMTQLLSSLKIDETIVHIHGWTKCLSSSIFKPIFDLKVMHILTIHDYFSICPNGGLYNYKQNEKCFLEPFSVKCIFCNCDSRNCFFKFYRVVRLFIQNKYVGLNSKIKNVITISDLSEKLIRRNMGINTKFFRIYNPINFTYSYNKNYLDNTYYLYLGRVCKEKDVNLFCETLAELKRKGIVVGDGELKETLEKKYANIIFVGWQGKEEVEKYIQGAKALIFTSNWYETMGLTVLEAQIKGIPVFVRNGNAAVEFTNYNDLIFENKEDLKNKILFFEKKGAVNKNVINYNYFEPNTYIKQLIHCYSYIERIKNNK